MGGWTEITTIGDALTRARALWPDEEAVVLGPDRVTYKELEDRVTLVAQGLHGLGVGPQVRVGLLMPNVLELIEAVFAVAALGGISVPLNTRYQEADLGYVIGHAELSLVVTTDGTPEGVDFVQLLRKALPDFDEPEAIDDAGRSRSLIIVRVGIPSALVKPEEFERLVGSLQPEAVARRRRGVRIRETAMILYTSGTTANPKGCLLSHEAIVRTGMARINERRRHPGRAVIWTPCPLFHVGALVPLVGCIATGSKFVTSRRFDAADALHQLEAEGVTVALPLFPAFTQAMIDCPAFGSVNLSVLGQILTTGPRSDVERANAAFSTAKLVSGYGMTEVCGVAASSRISESDGDRLEWDGHPFGGIEMQVIDPDTGNVLPSGSIGELVVRGYCTFDGYYRDPEATRQVFDQDGWFHTGDMGMTDEDGRVAFRGRYKDMLKVGGENVAALEVESFLSGHPEVRHVEVVGVADGRFGEVVAAIVERQVGSSLREEDVIAFCQGRIARFKVPKYVRFVESDDWPMSATKVNKVALREMLSRDPELSTQR